MYSKTNIRLVLISINLIILIIIIKLVQTEYFAITPDKSWWTALTVIIAISTAFLLIGINLLLKENDYKNEIKKLRQEINRVSNANQQLFMRTHRITSNLTNVQDASENENEELWKELMDNIKQIEDRQLFKPITLRSWSRIAWKNDYLDYSVKLREKAFDLDKDNLRSRVMLCSALTYKDQVDKTRIESILENTYPKNDSELLHYYNIKGNYFVRIGEYYEAEKCFSISKKLDADSWAYKGFVVSLLMNNEYDNSKIHNEIEKFSYKSQWFMNSSLNHKPFRLMVESFFNKEKINDFYNLFNTKKIVELTQRYNNNFMKHKLLNFYNTIENRFNDKELSMVYLTYYYFIGTYDKEADTMINDEKIINGINDRIKNVL